MKLFKRRKTTLKGAINRATGVTKAKRKFTKMTGGRAARNPKALIQNTKRKVKRKTGFDNKVVKAARNHKKPIYFLGIKIWG